MKDCMQCGAPFAYPHLRPARDSYGAMACCPPPIPPCPPQPCPPPPPHHGQHLEVPTRGLFVGNGFEIINTYPYLIDTSRMSYGSVVRYSDTVMTKLTRRPDPSCIDVIASFNLTDTSLTNTVLNDFLKKYINNQYESLNGILPMLKGKVVFKIYYTVTGVGQSDMMTGVLECTCNDIKFHFTDIKDIYITTTKNLIIKEIPAMTYTGLYTFTFNRIEAYMPYVDTQQYVEFGGNPLYQFTNNNTKITVQHDILESKPDDGLLLIAEAPINISVDYQANITNRVRLSFTAFLSNVIATPDTLEIWENLNEPTDAIITDLRQRVSSLETLVADLQSALADSNTRIDELEILTNQQAGEISALQTNLDAAVNRISALETNYTLLATRVTALENRPIAVKRYAAETEFVPAQLTYTEYGKLYQTTTTFVADGDMDTDIAAGKIVPLSNE